MAKRERKMLASELVASQQRVTSWQVVTSPDEGLSQGLRAMLCDAPGRDGS
jgi:hypothetical protein